MKLQLNPSLFAQAARLLAWLTAVSLAGCLLGCASAPPAADAKLLLNDQAFAASPDIISADAVMAPSPDMLQFAGRLKAQTPRLRDLRSALMDAIYRSDSLQLRYDTIFTRTAAQAFEARAGNCLSLMLMTAALAKELGLQVTYQSVLSEDSFSRHDALVFASGHVNLVLGRSITGGSHIAHDADREMTVDFLPNQNLGAQRVMSITEAAVRAMYMNNRAAELLGDGKTTSAYWWAREALLQDPRFLPGINTLGVVYLREGQSQQAEAVFRYVLQRDPRQTSALTNLVRVLTAQGRSDEAAPWAAKLAALQPDPPFMRLDQGRAALAAGDVAKARDLFLAELRQQPYQHEAHYWLAVALATMGDNDKAARHLALAADHSTTTVAHDLYTGKLERLRQAQRAARPSP